MNIEEYLKSDDIEIAELNANILLQKGMNIVQIENLLEKTQYRVNTFDRNYISLRFDEYARSIKNMKELNREIELELMYGNKYRK